MTRRHGRLLVLFLAAICLTLLLRTPTVTHQVQNELHGYIHHITSYELVSDISEYDSQDRPRGAWSKPAYLLGLIVTELAKPAAERLEWIFWFDADTIVLNPHTPLEIFLPPDSMPELENIHLLMAKNMDGLNSGAFALRVHPWSVSILSTVLAYPIFEAARYRTDQFRDQSAFQWLLQPNLKSPLFNAPFQGKDYWAEVPMRWFNSLPFNNAFSKGWDWIFNHNMTDELFEKGTEEVYQDGHTGGAKPWKVMQGDMVVHFAGANPVRDSWMGGWLERAEAYLPEWSNATKTMELKKEALNFWDRVADRICKQRKALDAGKAVEAASARANRSGVETEKIANDF
ncbi:glycosyltransferase family 34 protein [Hyaloscypha variabilis F]|uniref:Glycosyltransferase family 34 protein n=1 Tax=Hyaloscypha variabilis (strain UAMH 11265 / GT02V1 / F) TaxID=1149755 RepID=A0A2J6RU43_HYAVF|nr:glycosyltransferase family 34 protein [Hyaloscypha variabilis F]